MAAWRPPDIDFRTLELSQNSRDLPLYFVPPGSTFQINIFYIILGTCLWQNVLILLWIGPWPPPSLGKLQS